ncbi:MAG: hypothetical protein P4L48_10000 [Mycobacterium sp.]|nr:hypothetical protein [Mycobacterium sp.]
MTTISVLAAAASIATVAFAPASRAAETVTYQVTSDAITSLDVEYVDQSGRRLLTGVTLPWQIDVTLDDVKGPLGRGGQIRADWRPKAASAKWVTVRVLANGQLLCQSTLDVGNATCYGNTPHVS